MTVVFLVVSGFAATNIDNLLLLVSWILAGQAALRSLLAGYSLAMIAVLTVALLFGLLSNFIPIGYIGFLGVVPVLLGLRILVGLFRNEAHVPASVATNNLSVLAIATILLANSIDTMLIFAPLLADSSVATDALITVAFLIVATAWFFLAVIFSRNVSRLRRVSFVAQWLAPLIMIVVGLYILDNTVTDVIAGH
jgi:cadmium resistance protein CadD (predicted permease)